MPKMLTPYRFWIVQFFVAVLFLVVAYQLYQLTIVRRKALLDIANKQHFLKVVEPPTRGQILDRAGKPLATNLKIPSIYAVPRMLPASEKDFLAKKVSEILNLETSFVQERLSRDKAFVWLKRRVRLEEANQIRALERPVLGILEEYKRFYPQGDLLAHVMGFTNIDNKGLEGIELLLNQTLEGRAGVRYTKRDALGREIKAFEAKAIAAVDGNQVILTIDHYIQYLTERALEKAFRKWKAKGAWAMVMEPHTGRILAMASRPNYDPNEASRSAIDTRRNRVITDMYEPGSVFKIVAASAALNEQVASPEDIFDCENGEYRYYRNYVLHDVHPYEKLSFEDVIIKSSNIGTVKIAALLTPEVFQRYITAFGFGEPSGVDLPGEAPGFTRPPRQWSKTSPYNIPIGHEVMVTALQMTRAMAAIANGGALMKPYILDRIQDQAGITLTQNRPKRVHQVIRPEVAATMRSILTRVVEVGTGKRAQIEGIDVAGKTGTAQKVLPEGGGYSKSDYLSSFVGFAPADQPQLVMTVVLDDPGPKYYGGTVAAPVFREVMEAALLSLGHVPAQEERSLSLSGS